MHLRVPFPERKIRVHVLEPFESIFEDIDVSLQNCTTLESVDIPGMNHTYTNTSFGARPVAWDTFTVHGPLARGARSHASTVILEQMFGAFFHARCTVRVLSFGVHLPRIRRRIVNLHWRTLLLADTVIVEVATSYTVTLFGSRATSGAEQVTALARFTPETPPLEALRTARFLGKLLTVLGAITPAALFTKLVTGGAFALWRSEIIHVNGSAFWIRDDLLPVDGFHVAQVVVVEEADATPQNIAKSGQFQGVHLGKSNDQGEFLFSHIHFKQRPATDNLETWKYDSFYVDVRDQNVSGHFSNVLQEAQIQVLVLEPCQFEVAIHIRAVGVAVFQVPVMVVTIRRHRHTPIGPNADCNKKRT